MVHVLHSAANEPPAQSTDRLTPREAEVLGIIYLANKEIAYRLGISIPTVKVHVGRVLRKLGADSKAHAVALAFRRAA